MFWNAEGDGTGKEKQIIVPRFLIPGPEHTFVSTGQFQKVFLFKKKIEEEIFFRLSEVLLVFEKILSRFQEVVNCISPSSCLQHPPFIPQTTYKGEKSLRLKLPGEKDQSVSLGGRLSLLIMWTQTSPPFLPFLQLVICPNTLLQAQCFSNVSVHENHMQS